MSIPMHYVSYDEQDKSDGESACGSTNWRAGTTDESEVTCPECLAEIERWQKRHEAQKMADYEFWLFQVEHNEPLA